MGGVEAAGFVTQKKWGGSCLTCCCAKIAELGPGCWETFFFIEKRLPVVGDFCYVWVDLVADSINKRRNGRTEVTVDASSESVFVHRDGFGEQRVLVEQRP